MSILSNTIDNTTTNTTTTTNNNNKKKKKKMMKKKRLTNVNKRPLRFIRSSKVSSRAGGWLGALDARPSRPAG